MKKLFNILLVMLTTMVFAYFVYAAVDSVSLDSPADNYWSSSANVSFNCTAVMNDSEEIPGNISLFFGLTSDYSLTFNSTNQSALENATTTQIDVTNIPDGNYTWTCYAANESFDETRATENRTFFVDTTVPNTVTLNEPANNNYSSGRNLTFNWTVADNLDVNLSCNISIDSVYNLTDGYGVLSGADGVVEVLNMPEGTHTWSVTCWDEVLNYNTSETRNFTIDLSNPSVTLGISNLTWFSSGTSLILNATADDYSLEQCHLYGDFNGTYLFNQTVNATDDVKVNFGALNLAQGTYVWNVKCNDTFNNEAFASTNRTFYVDLTNPSPSISLSSASISTYGGVTVTCGATDTPSASTPTTSWSVSLPDGTVSADNTGEFTDTSVTGTYTATCTATDNSGRTGTRTDTFVVSVASSSGGSSSSSNGPSSTESHIITLSSSPVTISITNPENVGVREIEIEAKEDVNNVKVTVKKYSNQPSDVDDLSGEVYSYLNIEAPLAQGKIKEAKIRFGVSKTWLSDNDLSSDEIILMRFADKWEELETKKIGGTEDDEIFEAVTKGFSYFAVTSKAIEVQEQTEETEEEETKPAIVSEESKPAEETKEGSNAWILITVVILALLIVGFLLYTKKDWLMNLFSGNEEDVNSGLRRKLKKRLK